MAATTNSPYQAIRVQHLNGVPPNCDPQRSNETFAAYLSRMKANGFPPDIGATESDSDYQTRIAGYDLPPTGLFETVETAISSSVAQLAYLYVTSSITAGTANTASYVAGANVDGTVVSASYASLSNAVVNGTSSIRYFKDFAGTPVTMSFTNGALTSVS